jgi:hypothetical protein
VQVVEFVAYLHRRGRKLDGPSSYVEVMWKSGAAGTIVQRKGGAYDLQCRFCQRNFKSTYPNRFLQHLLQEPGGLAPCPVTEFADEHKLLVRQLSDNDRAKRLKRATSPESSQASGLLSWISNGKQEVADLATASMVAETGISMNAVSHPAFVEFVRAAIAVGSSWRPPSRATITRRIPEVKKMIKDKLHGLSAARQHTGCSLSSDGWSNVQRRPLMNVVLSWPDGQEFLGVVDCSTSDWRDGESGHGHVPTKDARFIVDSIKMLASSVDVSEIVAVFMDNAAPCRAALSILEQEWPSVFGVGCLAHALDLVLEDIGKIEWVKDTIAAAKKIVKVIRGSHWSLGLFRNVGSQLKEKRSLLFPGETRFGTVGILLTRLVELREVLLATVGHNRWHSKVLALDREGKAAAQEVKNTINDAIGTFWPAVRLLIKIFMPIVDVMRMADSMVPCIGKVYYRVAALATHVEALAGNELARDEVHQQRDARARNRQARFHPRGPLQGIANLSAGDQGETSEDGESASPLTAEDRDYILDSINRRWELVHSPIHSAGLLLDPEYRLHDYSWNRDIQGDWEVVVNKMIGSGPGQQPLRDLVTCQLVEYRDGTGPFADVTIFASASTLPAHKWWRVFGRAAAPELAKIAVKVLAQVASSSCCERNWSTFSFIHSKLRNRMSVKLAEDLVYIHSNMKLVHRQDRIKSKTASSERDKAIIWEWYPESDEADDEAEDSLAAQEGDSTGEEFPETPTVTPRSSQVDPSTPVSSHASGDAMRQAYMEGGFYPPPHIL